MDHFYFGVINISTYPGLPLCARPPFPTLAPLSSQEWVWKQKEASLSEVSAPLGLSIELKIKPQAESDMSAATHRASLTFPTTHLEEEAFL